MSNLVIFEDEKVNDLGSIVLMRPAFDLLCGITPLREKLLRAYSEANADITFAIRECLHDVYREQLGEEKVKLTKAGVTSLEYAVAHGCGLFLNGRALVLSSNSLPSIEGNNEVGYIKVERKNTKTKETMEKYDELLYLRTDRTNPELIKLALSSQIQRTELERKGYNVREIKGIPMIRYPWDLIINNSKAIKTDFKELGANKLCGSVNGVFFMYLEKNGSVGVHQISVKISKIYRTGEELELARLNMPVFVGEGSLIDPGIVIDTTKGPVYIGKDVKITNPSRITGPCYIGNRSIIDGAKLREGNSIGPVCRIGGELEESIFQGYSNKHHDGFWGHAFVAPWVNIGAMATNSDLKNTYGTVKVPLSPKKTIDSGEFKTIGSYIGDHTKIGINVPLTTGTHIGVACNLFNEMPPKYVPSFSWGSGENLSSHSLDKMLETAEAVMDRRDKIPSDAYKALLTYINNITEKERK